MGIFRVAPCASSPGFARGGPRDGLSHAGRQDRIPPRDNPTSKPRADRRERLWKTVSRDGPGERIQLGKKNELSSLPPICRALPPESVANNQREVSTVAESQQERRVAANSELIDEPRDRVVKIIAALQVRAPKLLERAFVTLPIAHVQPLAIGVWLVDGGRAIR